MDNGGDANNVEMNGGNDMHNEEGEEEWDGYTTIDQFTVFCCVNLQEWYMTIYRRVIFLKNIKIERFYQF